MKSSLKPLGYVITKDGIVAVVSLKSADSFESVLPALAEELGGTAQPALPETLPPGGLTVRLLQAGDPAQPNEKPRVADPEENNPSAIDGANNFFKGWKPQKQAPTPPVAPPDAQDYGTLLTPRKPRG